MTLVDLMNVFAVIGGCLALYELFNAAVYVYLECRMISWKKIQVASDQLFQRIADSRYYPDIIIGLGRGGAIAAGLLSAHFRDSSQYDFRLTPIASIDRIYLQKNGKRIDVRITGFHSIDVYRKNVLLLNADCYTGETLKRAKEVLSWDHPNDLRTGTILSFTKDDKPSYEPDFCGIVLPASNRKKRLPWRSKKYKFEDSDDLSLDRVLAVLHGHVATGKTSVTDAIAKGLGYTPLYSDWYWFKYGLSNRNRDDGVSFSHNKHMLGRCWSAIGSGYHVVLDCTSRWRTYRDEIRQSFEGTDVTVVFIHCFCPRETALKRIEKRQFIGPHDFGTFSEYERIESDFDELGEDEIRSMNLIHIDTDKLICQTAPSEKEQVNVLMRSLIGNIEQNYFAKVRGQSREDGSLDK